MMIDDMMTAKIAELRAELAALADRLTRIEAGQDMDRQQSKSALERIAKSAEDIARVERRR
jgi:hypothetical protein